MAFDEDILSNEVASILQSHQPLNVENHADRYCKILLKEPYAGQYAELCSMKVFGQLGVKVKLLDDTLDEKSLDFELIIDEESVGLAECYSLKKMSTGYFKKYDDVEYPENSSIYSLSSGGNHKNTDLLLRTQQLIKKIVKSNFDGTSGIIRIRLFELPTGSITTTRIEEEICEVICNLFANSEKSTPASYEHETYKDAKTGMSVGFNIVSKPEFNRLIVALQDRNLYPSSQATSEALRMIKEKIKNKPFEIKKRHYLIVHSFDSMLFGDVIELLSSREEELWQDKHIGKCAGIIWLASSEDIFVWPFDILYTWFILNPSVDHHPKLKALTK